MRKLLPVALPLLAAALIVATVIVSAPPTLPQAAQQALEAYLSPHDYTIVSVQLAATPEHFAGVCSFFDPEDIEDLWCVSITGGPGHFSHVVLHEGEPRWTVVPVFDFDRAIF